MWVLNARRVELSAAPPEGDWGGGCWLDRGGLGGEICDFVADLLRQVCSAVHEGSVQPARVCGALYGSLDASCAGPF